MNNTDNKALIKIQNSLGEEQLINLVDQLPIIEEYRTKILNNSTNDPINFTSNIICAVLPGVLMKFQENNDKDKIIEASYRWQEKTLINYNRNLKQYFQKLQREVMDLNSALIEKFQGTQKDLDLAKEKLEKLQVTQKNQQSTFQQYQDESERIQTNLHETLDSEKNRSIQEINDRERLIESQVNIINNLQEELNNAKLKISEYLNTHKKIWKNNHRIESLDSYDLKQLKNIYTELEKDYLELTQSREQILLAYKLIVEENSGLNSRYEEITKQMNIQRSIHSQELTNRIDELQLRHDFELVGVRKKLADSQINYQCKFDDWGIEKTDLEQTVAKLKEKEQLGFKTLNLLNERLKASEDNYQNLLNNWTEKERELNLNIKKQEEQLQGLKNQILVQSLASASQGIFTACLPPVASSWINSGIQVYSGYTLVGIVPACSGLVFVSLVSIGIWETKKRLWRKVKEWIKLIF